MEDWELDLAVKFMRSGHILPRTYQERMTPDELKQAREAAGLPRKRGPQRKPKKRKPKKRKERKPKPVTPFTRPVATVPSSFWPDLSGDDQVEADIRAYAEKHHMDVWGAPEDGAELDDFLLTEDVFSDEEPFTPLYRCGCGRRSRERLCSSCASGPQLRDGIPADNPEEVVARVAAEFKEDVVIHPRLSPTWDLY